MDKKTDSSLEVYRQLIRYLTNEIPLNEFRNWFDASTWPNDENPESYRPSDIAGEVELRLAEFSNGHWSEEELRNNFHALVRSPLWIRLAWGDSRDWPATSSASGTDFKYAIVGEPRAVQASTDIRLEVVFG